MSDDPDAEHATDLPEGTAVDESLIPPELWAEFEKELDQYEAAMRESMDEHFADMAENEASEREDDASKRERAQETDDVDYPHTEDIHWKGGRR